MIGRPGRGWMRRKPLVLALAVLLLAAGWWLSRALAAGAEVSWVVATVDDLVIGVEVEGTLASCDSSVLMAPQVQGLYDYKIAFMAPEGEQVAAGVPVLGFDASELQRRLLTLQTEAEEADKQIEKLDADQQQGVMQLQLQLAEARAKHGKAELKADVPTDLQSANGAEVAALDVHLAAMEVTSVEGQLAAKRAAGEAQRASLVAQKERAERLVAETEAAIERMMVTAPRAGTVIYVTNWRDEKKKIGDSVWRFDGVIELPDLTTMLAQGEVDEADSGRISEGLPVTLRLDAHPDIEYTAHIGSIWKTVQRKRRSRSPVKVVRLDLELDQTDTERMRPGMRFRGSIESQRLEQVLQVPVHAVFPTAAGPVVYRRATFGHEAVRVELGARSTEMVEVTAGLNPGDRIAATRPTS